MPMIVLFFVITSTKVSALAEIVTKSIYVKYVRLKIRVLKRVKSQAVVKLKI